MCMRFNSSVRPLVALLVFLLYIRCTPAVLLLLRSTLVNPALNYIVPLVVLYQSFPSFALSLSLCLVLIAPPLACTLTYATLCCQPRRYGFELMGIRPFFSSTRQNLPNLN
ncbi:hypothetical protein B0H14DRAFT_178392 [Mycena olivaceomarginata]|nr:hypothetical protein B0H14DRAFT_178392 [Mycena olivaceomarginata]